MPGMQLNIILILVLTATDHFLREFSDSIPALYLLTMAGVGAVTYAVFFFFLPLPELSSEKARIKERARFTVIYGF